MTDRVTYAYAVARNTAGLAEAAASLTGVAGAPVRLLSGTAGDELVLAVSAVPSQDFQEDSLKGHFEDLTWLETVARAHHGVIEALGTRTTVLPLRLATVYLDDERARSALDNDRDAFTDGLARLAAHVEWGVKIYVESSPPPPAATTAPAAPAPEAEAEAEADAAGAGEGEGAAAAGLTPGRAYLRHRRAQQSVRDDVYRAAQAAAERVEAAGGRHASGHARHRVQQGELATAHGENVLNDAYLVPLDHAEEFRTEVSTAADGLQGVRVEVTGPWAPYSFAMPPSSSEDAGEGARP